MKPSLRDVAEKAGVSVATVSMALRGHPHAKRFQESTRKRIKKIAMELGYKANFFSSQLRRSQSQLAKLYLNSLQDLYGAVIAQNFQRRAAERGYWTLISASCGSGDVIDRKIVGDHGVSAVAAVGQAAEQLPKRTIRMLVSEGVRLISIGRNIKEDGVSSVFADEREGVTLAAKHIYDNGSRNVWVLGDLTRGNSSRRLRVRVFKEYADGGGLPEPTFIVLDAKHPDTPTGIGRATYNAVKANLAELGRPDAVFTVADIHSYAAMRALYEAGLRVGEDVAVVGYDDFWPSEFSSPSLTAVRLPMEEMGLVGADMLIDTIEGKIRPGRKIVLKPELIVRDSSFKAG